jgi:peptide-methionine (R)-S-oxide reductase
MNTMKRLTIAACLLAPIAFVAGCGDGDAASQAPPPPSTANKQADPSAAPAAAPAPSGDAITVRNTSNSEIFKSMNIQIYKDKVVKPEDQWKKELTPQQYEVLREKGTERAFTGKYWNTKDDGIYRCSGCAQPLFVSDTKFDSGCGWPSFFKPVAEGVITEHVDTSYGMKRTEVTCTRCGAHLGHVFEDAPDQPTGLRYCINSVSIDLEKKDESKKADAAPVPAPGKP